VYNYSGNTELKWVKVYTVLLLTSTKRNCLHWFSRYCEHKVADNVDPGLHFTHTLAIKQPTSDGLQSLVGNTGKGL